MNVLLCAMFYVLVSPGLGDLERSLGCDKMYDTPDSEGAMVAFIYVMVFVYGILLSKAVKCPC